MEIAELKDMSLHELIYIDGVGEILRVPNGWIYRVEVTQRVYDAAQEGWLDKVVGMTSTFVPEQREKK
jgi:hypothetical protein